MRNIDNTQYGRKNERGFTLLEVILVISVLSVLVLFAIRYAYQSSNQVKIKKAGQELVTVLQAANYYHGVKAQWPVDNIGSACGVTPAHSDFDRYYLPKTSSNESDKTVFGSYYCWKKEVVDEQGVESPLFNVYLPVLGAHACIAAKKVAAGVPNAVAVSEMESVKSADEACSGQNRYYVRAQAVPQGQAAVEARSSFDALGQCVPNNTEETPECVGDGSSGTACCHVSGSSPTEYKIHFPACAAGMTPKVIYLPAFITYLHDGNDPQTIYDRDILHEKNEPLRHNPTPVCQPAADQAGDSVCSLTLGVGMHTRFSGIVDLTAHVSPYTSGSVGAVYMVACQQEVPDAS